MLGELKYYLKFILKYDFSLWALPLAALGLLLILRRRAAWGSFLLLYGGTLLFLILNYKGPGKFVFFLSTYVLIAIAVGVGLGGLLERLQSALAARLPRSGWVVCALLAVLIAWVMIAPFWGARGQALQAGAAAFVTKDDTYPLHNLQEPHQLAEQRLAAVEDNAVLLLDWKTLYATYYLAQVEGRKPGVRILEDILDRGDGQLADSLVAELQRLLQAGLPVYSDRPYPALEEIFRFEALPGSDLVRLRLRFE